LHLISSISCIVVYVWHKWNVLCTLLKIKSYLPLSPLSAVLHPKRWVSHKLSAANRLFKGKEPDTVWACVLTISCQNSLFKRLKNVKKNVENSWCNAIWYRGSMSSPSR
jgi:hypothetical protein